MTARISSRGLLNGTAFFALAWVIVRACVQAITAGRDAVCGPFRDADGFFAILR